MPSLFGSYLMLVTAFGLVVIFIVILKAELPKPKYENRLPNGGKIFSEETLKRLEEMREENNPNNQHIGIINGRCQFCGSTKIDKEWKSTGPFNHQKNFIKNCNCCKFVVDTM